MKRTLLLSLSLIFAINVCAINTTQAINWNKNSIKAIGTIGFLGFTAAIFYGLKKLASYKNQNMPVTNLSNDQWTAMGAAYTASNAALRNPFSLSHASMHSPFATF